MNRVKLKFAIGICSIATMLITGEQLALASERNTWFFSNNIFLGIGNLNKQSDRINIVEDIDNIAKRIVVKISANSDPNFGSGVLIARQDDTYYLVTASYIVNTKERYRVITPDGNSHVVKNQNIQQLNDSKGLTIVSFQSKNNYDIATIAKYKWGEQWIFASGFTKDNTSSKSQNDRLLTGGKLFTQEQAPFIVKDTYSLIDNDLVYTNDSYRGMGGGALLDARGRLIGIHSGIESEINISEDGTYQELSLGYSLGISVNDLLTTLTNPQAKLKSELLNIESNPPQPLAQAQVEKIQKQTQIERLPAANNSSEYLNYGNQLWRYQKYDRAIAALETAIELDPKFHRAYYSLGLVAKDSGNYQRAVEAFEKATELNPNPYYYWRHLGLSYTLMQQYDRALVAYDRAIALDSNHKPPNSVLTLERERVLEEIGKN